MLRYLIVVDDVSAATAPDILPDSLCVLLVACVGIIPEGEGMMQHSRGKYFPQL